MAEIEVKPTDVISEPVDTKEDIETEDTSEEEKTDIKSEDTTQTDEKTLDIKSEENETKNNESKPLDPPKSEDTTQTEEKTHDIKSEENGTKTNESKPLDPPSLLQMKIIRQVEYYFGNVNLWRDKFLKEKVKEDDGWVTLECLITFNRLQSLSMDFDEIITALQKSKTGLLEIHEDRRQVRRSPDNPLPDPDDPMLRKASKMKTLHIKGFPTSYTLDDVQDFILSQHCQNIFVKMKYAEDKSRSFKGSIIVELSTLEEAEKFLKNEMKCEDNVLKVLRRDEYYNEKNEKRHFKRDSSGKRKSNDGDENGGYGKRTKGEENDENKEDNKKEDMEPPKLGCVLHFKGSSKDTSREDLKALFGEHEQVEWVDFDKGDTQGYVRFTNEGAAQKAFDAVKAANEDKFVIKEKECEGKIIEGIEEKNYWILATEERKRAARNKAQGNRGGNRGGRGRFQNNRGRRKDRNQDGWRKRRREWEYPKENSGTEKTENSEEKPKNKRTTFDDEGNVKETTGETVEKKTKVEEKTAVEA